MSATAAPEDWLLIEETVTTLQIMEMAKLPGITCGICADCVRDRERELVGISPKKQAFGRFRALLCPGQPIWR